MTTVYQLYELNGYDLVGTLIPPAPKRSKPFFKQSAAERAQHVQNVLAHLRAAPLLRQPRPRFVIITGLTELYRPAVEEWLSANNLKPDGVYYLQTSRTRAHMIEHKLGTALKLGVSVYFEDDPKIAKALAAGGLQVVLVSPAL